MMYEMMSKNSSFETEILTDKNNEVEGCEYL